MEHLGMAVSKNRGTPKWTVKIMENPIKHGMIWGKPPLYLETPIYTPLKIDMVHLKIGTLEEIPIGYHHFEVPAVKL